MGDEGQIVPPDPAAEALEVGATRLPLGRDRQLVPAARGGPAKGWADGAEDPHAVDPGEGDRIGGDVVDEGAQRLGDRGPPAREVAAALEAGRLLRTTVDDRPGELVEGGIALVPLVDHAGDRDLARHLLAAARTREHDPFRSGGRRAQAQRFCRPVGERAAVTRRMRADAVDVEDRELPPAGPGRTDRWQSILLGETGLEPVEGRGHSSQRRVSSVLRPEAPSTASATPRPKLWQPARRRSATPIRNRPLIDRPSVGRRSPLSAPRLGRSQAAPGCGRGPDWRPRRPLARQPVP